MNKNLSKINFLCLGAENKFGLLLTSFILASFILAIDMLYITPRFELAYHGIRYADLSENPFDFSSPNALHYRILAPMLGYFTFLRGRLFILVPLIFAFLFAASMYRIYRKKNYAPTDALLFTGFIFFTSTVLIPLTAPGYTDVIYYYFIFLSFIYIEKYIISASFFCLAMLTHESSLLMFPALLLYAHYINHRNLNNTIKYALAYSIAVLPHIAYRYYVSLHTLVDYNVHYYFNKDNILFTLKRVLPLLPYGTFYAFKLFWFFPVYIIYKCWRSKEFYFAIIIISILLLNFAQLFIAYDVGRMLCLGFPAILVSAEKIKSMWTSSVFTRFAAALTLFNFLILQCYVSCDAISTQLPLPYTLLVKLFMSHYK